MDAEGWLYKCWCDIGVADGRVGHLTEKFLPSNNLYYEYMLYDPTSSKVCGKCNLLPVCMGGCPFKRLKGVLDNCTSYRYILDRCLKNAVLGSPLVTPTCPPVNSELSVEFGLPHYESAANLLT